MLIKRLTLKNILSFRDTTVELGPLSVLIGPNAVGKSNLIEVIGLLQSMPSNMSTAILRGGGIAQWLWLGDANQTPVASIECDLTLSRGRHMGEFRYELRFTDEGRGFVVLDERLPGYLIRSKTNARFEPQAQGPVLEFSLQPNESVLSQFKNPIDPTPVTDVGRHFEQIRIYREFRTVPGSRTRIGSDTAAPKDALVDGGDNLALVLQQLDFRGLHDRIREYLRRFCERFQDLKLEVAEGLVRTWLSEDGLKEFLPAVRMSDGTLKFLSLLAALFHPQKPALMCLEEPEIGLHPDAMQLVAEVLKDASQSVQLIVTTHSDALIDWLSDQPESVLVCERDFDNGTQMKRYSKDQLDEWLEHYTLGELWRKGEIGGGRW